MATAGNSHTSCGLCAWCYCRIASLSVADTRGRSSTRIRTHMRTHTRARTLVHARTCSQNIGSTPRLMPAPSDDLGSENPARWFIMFSDSMRRSTSCLENLAVTVTVTATVTVAGAAQAHSRHTHYSANTGQTGLLPLTVTYSRHILIKHTACPKQYGCHTSAHRYKTDIACLTDRRQSNHTSPHTTRSFIAREKEYEPLFHRQKVDAAGSLSFNERAPRQREGTTARAGSNTDTDTGTATKRREHNRTTTTESRYITCCLLLASTAMLCAYLTIGRLAALLQKRNSTAGRTQTRTTPTFSASDARLALLFLTPVSEMHHHNDNTMTHRLPR